MIRASSSRAPGPTPGPTPEPTPGPTPAETWWSFLAADPPDPRVWQAAFAFLVGLDVVARGLAGGGGAAGFWPAAGLLAVTGATLVSLVVSWQRVPTWALAVLPVVDIAALGLTRLSPEGLASSVVVVLPAVWLARQLGHRGVVLAVAVVTLLHALPALLYLGVDAESISRAVLLPLVAGVAALAVSLGMEAVQARTSELEERGRQLERTLAAMAHQQRLNQGVLDTIDVGLVLLGPDGSYQALNRQHRAFVALAFPDGHGGTAGELGDVFAEDGTTRLTRAEMGSARAMRGEDFEDRRIWVGADPPTRRALSVSARAMRDPEGNFAGAALAYKDVTDLLNALRVKDEFVATVSHELRTPLTSIIGYVDLLSERADLDEQAQRQLQVVHRNGQRLLHLVEDLLRVAQVAGGRAEVSLQACDLSGVVREAVAAAEPVAAAADVTFSTSLCERMPARIDCERMGQLLDNLLSNAVKYNRPGGRATVLLDRDGDDARLEVRDTGSGMLPEERERLFTTFYRARHAVDHAIPGAGLGLSISKAIVDAHGGSIEVESEVHVGTVVRVRIPMLPPATDPDAVTAPRSDDRVSGPAASPDVAVGRG